MKQRSYLIGITLITAATLFATGCGKKDDTANSNDSSAAAKGAGNGVAPGVAAAAAAAQAAANGANKPMGPPIKSTDLANYLPKLSGYTAGNPEHMDMNSMGFSYSMAKSDYTMGNNKVTVTIFDYNHQAALSMAYSMFLNNYSMENDNEKVNSDQINGFPGWVDLKKKESRGTVGVVIGDRIYVVIESSNVTSTDQLESIAKSMDLSGIAKLTS
jgi:hypothetical protein